jgi:hypothetical protein
VPILTQVWAAAVATGLLLELGLHIRARRALAGCRRGREGSCPFCRSAHVLAHHRRLRPRALLLLLSSHSWFASSLKVWLHARALSCCVRFCSRASIHASSHLASLLRAQVRLPDRHASRTMRAGSCGVQCAPRAPAAARSASEPRAQRTARRRRRGGVWGGAPPHRGRAARAPPAPPPPPPGGGGGGGGGPPPPPTSSTVSRRFASAVARVLYGRVSRRGILVGIPRSLS